MPAKPNPYTYIHNDIKKMELFWNQFKVPGRVTSSDEKWKGNISFFEQISSQNSVLILIWDASNNRILYAIDKKQVVGHEMSLYLAENGLFFSISNIHPDYLSAGLMMQQTAFEYIVESKETEQGNIIVNLDGLYKKSNGDYFHFLQQIVAIDADVNHPPTIFLSYIQDITYYKKEKTANMVITRSGEAALWNFNFDRQILEPIQSLSSQEKKVLAYLGKGKHSKEIAIQLGISSHTVDTHRRNLLKKTNCVDTTGLITYAKLVGLF